MESLSTEIPHPEVLTIKPAQYVKKNTLNTVILQYGLEQGLDCVDKMKN